MEPQKVEEAVGALPESEAEAIMISAWSHRLFFESDVMTAPNWNLSAGIVKPTDSCQEMLQ